MVRVEVTRPRRAEISLFFSRVNPFLYGRTKVLRSDLIQLNDVHQFEDMHTVLGIVYAFQECQQ